MGGNSYTYIRRRKSAIFVLTTQLTYSWAEVRLNPS
jgi:hypothetical protein